MVWPKGTPPSTKTRDWSCHGSLGWTLQQALNEMEEEADASAAERETAPSPEDDEGGTTTAAAASAPNKSDATTAATNNLPPRPRIRPTAQMRKAVLEALSTGMHSATSSSTAAATKSQTAAAPHGILKGRINYYQRQGSRWRFEVDDVRLRRRPLLARIRRRQERPSFWEISAEASRKAVPPAAKQQNNVVEVVDAAGTSMATTEMNTSGDTNSKSNRSKFSFELLAYDDIE